jgi:hypothetical protein
MVIDLFSQKDTSTNADKRLSDEIRHVISELRKADLLFNEVTDSYEIESVIYRMKELEMHYSFLIKEAKLNKLTVPDGSDGVFI